MADMDPVLKAIADPWLIYYRIDRSPSSIAQWLVAIFQDEVLDPVFGFAIARTTRYIGIRDSAKSLSRVEAVRRELLRRFGVEEEGARLRARCWAS